VGKREGKGEEGDETFTFLVMMKEVPIAIELETANANPMYLSPGETDEMISSEPLIANTVRLNTCNSVIVKRVQKGFIHTCLNANTRLG